MMKKVKILLWTLISLIMCSGSVRGREAGVDLPVCVDGPAGTVIVEDAKGNEVDRALIGGGMEHVFRLQPVSLSECRFRIRQIKGAQKAQYDERVYEVTVVSYLDEEVQEVCIKVISCDGKKRDSIAFHNIPENETVPKTGDPGRTRNYAGLLMMSAGGLWITMTGRRKIR